MKYLVAGLGNAGLEYANSRHNAGFLALDYIAEKHELVFDTARYCFKTQFRVKNRQITLIKPTTYMNLSGKAVRYWLRKLELTPDKLLVIVDDIALPLGMLRIRHKGSDGGHNGLLNIIYELQTEEFARLRIGIGNEFSKGRQVDYVLGDWEPAELDVIKAKLPRLDEAVSNFVLEGVERTMSKFNE